MPQDRENPLARFAHAIAEQDGFSFGTPRLSDDGATVAVPILGAVGRPRVYILAADVAKQIDATDVGRIDHLRIRNASPNRVLLPPGSLFAGPDTASRATTQGVLLGPEATREVEVKCVQPSQPIRDGARLALAPGLAPAPLTQALLARDQGLVWATLAASPISSPRVGATKPEALSDTSPAQHETSPSMCGLAILDAEGLVALEVFDSPSSWSVAARELASSSSRPSSLRLDPTGAITVLQGFLRSLARRPQRSRSPESWAALDVSAECTAAGGQGVHLLAFGRDLTHSEISDERHPVQSTAELQEASVVTESTEAGEVAVAAASAADMGSMPETEPPTVSARPRRKVLTSGWDGTTFESLERYAAKEFRGDRSAAIRFLVRHQLQARGYMGPHPLPQMFPLAPAGEAPEPAPPTELGRAAAEGRIRDFERIAQTELYADWLRKRARLGLETMAATGPDDLVRATAKAALDRLPDEEPTDASAEELPEVLEPSTPAPAVVPPPPPIDVRPLLRRAFASSGNGRYPEALALFDEVLLAEPENRTALLGRAVALRRSGKAQEALDALDRVLAVEPANAAALLNRGRLLQERGDLTASLETFERLVAAAPNDWDVWMARGDVLSRLGRIADALRSYSEALRRNPDDEELQVKIRGLEKVQPAPTPPPLQRIPLPREIQEGQSYLVRERRPDLSLRALRALVARGVPALFVTRESAEAVHREAALADVRVLELSHAPGEGRHDPTALVALTKVVEHFVLGNHGRGVILLDGLPLLVLENGARETILFIERVNEAILPSHAVFLVSLAPGDLGDREVAVLERSLRVVA